MYETNLVASVLYWFRGLLTWMISSMTVNVRSCVGPRIFSIKFIIVKLLHSMWTSLSLVDCFKSITCRKAKILRHIRPSILTSCCLKTAYDMLSVSVVASNLQQWGHAKTARTGYEWLRQKKNEKQKNGYKLVSSKPTCSSFSHQTICATVVSYNTSNFVMRTNLGSRCRGHGTRWKSCGTLKIKFNTCGIKNKSIVLLKCPNIATTANVMPAK